MNYRLLSNKVTRARNILIKPGNVVYLSISSFKMTFESLVSATIEPKMSVADVSKVTNAA